MLNACGAPTTASEAEEPSTSQKQAQVIKEWVGVGAKTTEPFIVDSAPWTIDWTNVPTIINNQSLGLLQIMVYNVEKPEIPLAIVANSKLRESGAYPINEKGTFYMMINATNTRWAVKVRVVEE